jgi:hypothetical protein
MSNYGLVKMLQEAKALRPIACGDRYEITLQ